MRWRAVGHFCAGHSQKYGNLKDGNLMDFHSLSVIHDEGKSPCMVWWLGLSKLEFYGECNGNKYNLMALVLLSLEQLL